MVKTEQTTTIEALVNSLYVIQIVHLCTGNYTSIWMSIRMYYTSVVSVRI